MTTDQPPPGSAWASYCPDAYPAAWLDPLGLAKLPAGFTRFATADEAVLIAGEITPAEFENRTGRASRPANPSPCRGGDKPAKPPGRFMVLNGFIDLELRKLSRAEIAVWLILFRDTKPDGTARTGQTDIARRAGLSRRGVQLALGKLKTKGLVRVVRRGRLNGGPSSYRVHPTGTRSIC